MSSITYNQRIIDYELNPDRADVILPALKIYIRTMQWGGVHTILVPKIGLVDGMIQELYKSNNNSNI
jgi:exopolyphosphatase/guanosine-5'-triphosphate,3'-diphosphate pyrophosphatase